MITVDVTNDQITRAFLALAGSIEDMTPLMQDIGEYMLESTKANFREGSAPDGTAWAPRKQSTLDAYAARGDTPRGGPLVGVTKALSTTIAYEPFADRVDWGSNMIYAAVMQFGADKGEFGTASNGSSIPWGDIPARPYLGIGPEDETAIVEIIGEYLSGAVQP